MNDRPVIIALAGEDEHRNPGQTPIGIFSIGECPGFSVEQRSVSIQASG
jgi:hypothetical protein